MQAELTAHLTTPVRLGYREQVDPPVVAPLGDVPGNEPRDRPVDLGDRDPSSGRGIAQGGKLVAVVLLPLPVVQLEQLRAGRSPDGRRTPA